ncbi:Lipoprotein [Sphingomonas antarctica]|uniref:hypothetical protein n=1 Tax=Sphingomonas antarctica TaxID=2040274 RepID=UPI0039E87206
MNKLLLATALIAGAAEARPRDIPVATPDGKAVSCLQTTRIRETRVRSDSVIDFYTSGGKVYRNTLPNSCPSLGFEEKFAYTTSTSQLCNVDIITVLQSGGGLSRGASCGLGMFQPVQLAKK